MPTTTTSAAMTSPSRSTPATTTRSGVMPTIHTEILLLIIEKLLEEPSSDPLKKFLFAHPEALTALRIRRHVLLEHIRILFLWTCRTERDYDLQGDSLYKPWYEAKEYLREWSKFVRLFYEANGWALYEVRDIRFALLKCRQLDGHYYWMPKYLQERFNGYHTRGKPGTLIETKIFNQIFFGFSMLRKLPGRGARRRFAPVVEPVVEEVKKEDRSKDPQETSEAGGYRLPRNSAIIKFEFGR